MSTRYRPSSKLIFISLLMAGLLVLNYAALEPAQHAAAERLAALQSTHANIQKQLQQTPSDADLRLLAQLQWTGDDWARSILNAMNAAQSRAQGMKASYTLGTPATVNLGGEDYAVQRIDLEVHAQHDPMLFRFIDSLQETLPGVSAITAMHVTLNEREDSITATVSLSLYRLVQP